MFFEMLESFKGHVQLGDLFRIVVQESDFHAQYTFMQYSSFITILPDALLNVGMHCIVESIVI